MVFTALVLAAALPSSGLAGEFGETADFSAFRFVRRIPPAAPRPPQVCSTLPMDDVMFPDALSADDRAALTIALNVSGSFEGADGWSNLSDDFDGQGVSLGLLNQNLGQGSLQPMLIRMRGEHPAKLRALLGAEHEASLLAMLSRWQAAPRPAGGAAGTLSILDDPAEDSVSSANQESVDWARANLYAGGKFTPEWKAQLDALASSPEYVSIQVAAATAVHEKALDEEKTVGVRQLRAYLFLFDVVVQNGGLYAQDLTDYGAWTRAHPAAPDTQRLEKVLELRLRKVRSQYKEDVRARKSALIHGTGKVHGERRDLPAQYCYDGLWPYRSGAVGRE